MKPLSKFFSRKAPQPAVEVPLPPPEVTDGRFFFPVQEIRVAVGNHSHINRPTVYYWGAPCAFEVGHYCSIAQGATFVLGGEHPKLSLSTNTTLHQINASNRWKGDVVIGNDVWVGANTTILSGVTIHTGAIIGAGATISKDVPAYAIVVGNPQRVLRYRFEPEVTARLLDSRWWEHNPETLNPLLMKSTDINDFLMLFENSV